MKEESKRYKVEVWDIMQLMFDTFKYNDHQLHFVADIDTHINEQLFKRAIDLSARIMPIIKCQYIETLPAPYWKSCNFSADDMVTLVMTNRIEEEKSKYIVLKTNVENGPQIRATILRSESCDSLCITMNHMLCDAAGFKQYLYELSDIYSNLKKDPTYSPPILERSRSMSQIFKHISLWNKIKILSYFTRKNKKENDLSFSFDGDENRPLIITHTFSPNRFLQIKGYAKQQQATINDALLAAFIRAIRKKFHKNAITLPCPIDLRKYIPNTGNEGICNLVSFIICDIDEIGSTYQDTLDRVKTAMNKQKEGLTCLSGVMIGHLLYKLFPYPIAKKKIMKSFSNPLLSLTNIGIIDQKRLQFEGVNITSSYMTGSIKYKPYFQIGVTTFKQSMTLTVNFHGTPNDEQEIKDFLQLLDEELPK
jgi:NRPS condensation-like uncharacterized protein